MLALRSRTGGRIGAITIGAITGTGTVTGGFRGSLSDVETAAGCLGAASDAGAAWSTGLASLVSRPSEPSSESRLPRSVPFCSSPDSSRRSRNASATSSSMELEWVFFSCTPSSGSISRITPGFTSNSRASSLILIFFIEETAKITPYNNTVSGWRLDSFNGNRFNLLSTSV